MSSSHRAMPDFGSGIQRYMIGEPAPIARVRRQATPVTPAPSPGTTEQRPMPHDLLREILNTPANFAKRIKAASLPAHQQQLVLRLLQRPEPLLINDVRANWYIKYTGQQPIEHDYYVIPDWLLPPVTTVEALEHYIADFRKERTGVTAKRVLEQEFTDILTLENPAITNYSQISVELLPEVMDVEDGRVEISFDRVKRVRVTITN